MKNFTLMVAAESIGMVVGAPELPRIGEEITHLNIHYKVENVRHWLDMGVTLVYIKII